MICASSDGTKISRDLDEIEAAARLLMVVRVGSRVLHYKERDNRLKEAKARFRSAKEKFSVSLFFI